METPNQTPLAIIGMACQLPGGNGLDEYWQLLTEGRSAVRELPETLLDRRLYHDPIKGTRSKSYSTIGAILEDRPLPPETYRLNADEAADADPAHLAFCHLFADACRHANLDPHQVPYTNAGVYVGHTRGTALSGRLAYGTMVEQTAQWLGEIDSFRQLAGQQQEETIRQIVESVRRQMPRRNERGGPNLESSQIGRVVSNAFGLDGPYVAMDSACASGLMALAYGAHALALGHIDMAVVGGCSISKFENLVLFSRFQSVSATGSRPFDADADGLIASEGSVILLVRRLDRAIADGNPIHAVVSGIGVSSDGRGKSLWAPRKEGQMAAFQRAYDERVTAGSLQYLEAHATSTPVGDATEVGALADALRPHLSEGKKIPIGSVKANIGHTLETAGLASVVKTVLAMQHRVIPPVINVNNLNPNIDWRAAPFYVPMTAEPWPEQQSGGPRRAGVNAFGIGGLNAHVVLDEYLPEAAHRIRVPAIPTDHDESIAVVGMSSIVPGALTVEAFWDLLTSQRDPKQEVPSDRWNVDLVHRPGAAAQWKTPLKRGGFITDFEYDWRKHKVPPKQVAGADPLQFMLLDAVDTALTSAGYVRGKFDGQHTGVVVGTMFDGEFFSQLQTGLRLPEFAETVKDVLRKQGAPEDQLDDLCETFSDLLLQRMPALEDETGSFTASTLASRITKTFDLMGGASAVSSGEASGLTALNLCSEMLLTGTCDLMICAAGQRALDLPNYEQLGLQGRLSPSGNPRPLAGDTDGIVPGEGVGVLILKRLADAERDGDSIRCIIRGIGIARKDGHQDSLETAIGRALKFGRITPDQVSAVELACSGDLSERDDELAAVRDTYGDVPARSALAGQIGHTMGASGMLSHIKAALTVEHVQKTDEDKPLKVVDAKGRVLAGVSSSVHNDLTAHVIIERPQAVEVQPQPRPVVAASSEHQADPWKIVAFEADTSSELLRAAEEIAQTPGMAWSTPATLASANYRAAIAASSPDELAKKAKFLVDQFEHPASKKMLAMRGIYFGEPSADSKVAFLFPGQGSQYPGMFWEFAQRNRQAGKHLAEIDAVLARMGHPSYESLVVTEADQLGRDVWRTQLSLLAADALMLRCVEQMGLRPDRISGHSFGEFPALLAAGAFDLENAVLATEHRCRCIADCGTAIGTMLSCQADESAVAEACERASDVFVANCNSTRQTVVGGSEEGVAIVAELLADGGIASTKIDVPRPFHTPMMRAIQSPFRNALDGVVIEPTRVPLLSSVTRKYVADPDEIRDNLATQLTEPVRFVDQIRRLSTEGVTLFVEIGPRQVLTRLAEDILSGDASFISTDVKNRSSEETLARVQAQATVLGLLSKPSQPPRDARPVATGHESRKNAEKSPQVSSVSGVPILLLEGEPYEMGLVHGRVQRDSIRRTMRVYCDLFGDARDRLPDIRSALDGLDDLVTPREIEEMRGVADGAGVAVENVFAHNLYVDPYFGGGCSQVAATTHESPVESLIHAANEDLPLGRTLKENLVRTIQVRKPNDALAYVTFAIAGQVGGINGVNSAGIAVTGAMLLDLPRRSDTTPGLLHGVVVRRILQQATDIESALEILKSHRRCGAWGVCISHAATDRVAYVEYDGAHLKIDHGRTSLISANHAQLLSGQIAPEGHSVCRQQRLEQLWKEGTSHGHISPSDAKAWLRDQVDLRRGRPVRFPTMNTPLRADTQISIVISAGLARLWVTRGPFADGDPDDYIELNLQQLIGLEPVDVNTEPASKDVSPEAIDLVLSAPEHTAAVTSVDGRSPRDASEKTCNRFVMRLLKTDPVPDELPRLVGRSLIVGDNALGRELASQLQACGNDAFVLAVGDDPQEAIGRLNQLWEQGPLLHIFMATPFDDEATTSLDADVWQARRQRGVLTPYFVCQRWFELVADEPAEQERSFIACMRLGGQFAFGDRVGAAESGAMSGLAKGLFFELQREGESWGRSKSLDFESTAPVADVARKILREVAHCPLDREVSYQGADRYVVRPINLPIEDVPKRDVKIKGPWVITGGARGVTAEVARGLGITRGAKLHLVGSSPLPQVQDAWREMNAEQTRDLRSQVMREAVARKEVPVHAWTRVEKAIEIDRTLRAFEAEGVTATYHGCDISDRPALAKVLDDVRLKDGPIEAIIHGAGFEKSTRFAKKKPELVQRTIAAKVDGAAALMELTSSDPLKLFLGFGSISGRFGGVGQTDYCLANEMLCKLIAWYRRQRPEVAITAMDWHLWDNVGMAMRAETRYVKEIAGIRLMPAVEGVQHLLDEIQRGCPEAETLITDWRYYKFFVPDVPVATAGVESHPVAPATSPDDVTQRFVLRMQPAPQSDTPVKLSGPAVILGESRDADALATKIRQLGHEVTLINTAAQSTEQAVAQLKQIGARQFPCHLFVMTGRDAAAQGPLDQANWANRRRSGVTAPFALCQEWIRQYISAGMPDATLTAAVALGGDFGFSHNPVAPEGGAISGLLKSIRIEGQKRPWPTLNVKIVDFDDATHEFVAARVFQEAISPSDLPEVGYLKQQRHSPQAVQQPISDRSVKSIPSGSHWVATGGARGVTAKAALNMAKQFGLQMHLIGSSPRPMLSEAWLSLDADGRKQLKKQTSREALAAGETPDRRWHRIDKDFEITDTLQAYADAGLSVTYHQCDVTDRDQIDRALAEIRTLGPITGILQGAGVVAPRRFEDLPAENLEAVVGVKLDATLALMGLTKNDPLGFFVGFGSIGGRYGANGQSDYTLGAEMMCKLIGQFRHERPEVCSVGFHWHAWAEVGMMMRPVNAGTLDIMKLALMTPPEGTRHIVNELLTGTPESEVMFTTDANGEHIKQHRSTAATKVEDLRLIDSFKKNGSDGVAESTFDPVADPFLREHRVRDRPILPLVMAIETIAEATALMTSGDERVVRLQNVNITEPMRLLGDDQVAARVHLSSEGDHFAARLTSDFCNQRGRLLKQDREQITADVFVNSRPCLLPATLPSLPKSWKDFVYPPKGLLVYHGAPLQCLKQLSDEGISAIDVPPDHVMAGDRVGGNWLTAPAVLDACFYALGVHTWHHCGNVSLPKKMVDVRFGRAPRPGERCYMTSTDLHRGDDEWIYDFDLFDADGQVLLQARSYHAVVIRQEVVRPDGVQRGDVS